jgi:hypothetical protein
MKEYRKGLWDSWKETVGYIGDFQSRLLLTVFYFTVTMPFGLVAHGAGDLLRVRRPPTTSAWMKRPVSVNDRSDARHQF